MKQVKEEVKDEVVNPLTVLNFDEQFKNLLSKEILEAMSKHVNNLIAPGSYEIKYVQVLCKKGHETPALEELAEKLEYVYSTYGIHGSLAICIGLELAGPTAMIAPFDTNWDYKTQPIGPGTLGWEKSEEEQEKFRDRILLISYPAIPWDKLDAVNQDKVFTPEGMLIED